VQFCLIGITGFWQVTLLNLFSLNQEEEVYHSKYQFIFDPNSNFTILLDDPVFTNIWDSTNTIYSLFSSSNMGYGSGITRTSLTITPVNSSPTIAASSCSPPADMLVPDMTLYLSNL
jgi:hypothetical protein